MDVRETMKNRTTVERTSDRELVMELHPSKEALDAARASGVEETFEQLVALGASAGLASRVQRG